VPDQNDPRDARTRPGEGSGQNCASTVPFESGPVDESLTQESEAATPMLDVHPAHHAASNVREFFIHIATIVIGLLIAVGLEQTVEWFHHRHQRTQLQEDLRNEAVQNLEVIARDMQIQELEPWFEKAMGGVASAGPQRKDVRVALPAPPCLPGAMVSGRYFAPSQAVWTTAKEAGLIELLPVDQARMQTRLARNYDFLASDRDKVTNRCEAILAMRRRFVQPDPSNHAEVWTMTSAQAEQFATAASETLVAIQGLLFRLRWSKVYEEGIVNGEVLADSKMMKIDQERFQDQPR
jgi:hypothetical protein